MQTQAFSGWQGAKGAIIALIAGMLLPLAFAPFDFYPIAVMSLSLLFLCWQGVSAKQAAYRGFLFGFGLFGVGVTWVYVAIHDFGHASILVSGLLTLGFVAFLASYLAVIGWAFQRFIKPSNTSSDYLLLLPVVWLAFDWFRGWLLSGFPWLELGVSQITGPLAGFIPIIGVLGVSWLTAFSAGLLVVLWMKRQLPYAIAFLVIWMAGDRLKTVEWTLPIGEPIKVTMIQGNIPQAIKWNPEQLYKTLALYEARTEQNWDSDLIIWPENAVTVFYHQAEEYFLSPLAQKAKQNQTNILLGIPVKGDGEADYYNSMALLGDSPHFYHKQHLVPFGDYIPFEWLRGLIAFFDLPMSSFVPGESNQTLMEIAGYKVGISICYEDVFSSEIRPTLPMANLLVNATNNAWYGDSFAPHQHLQISRSRALEMGRPVLRATTNGISAFIDHHGKLLMNSPQFEQAVITHDIQGRKGATPYVMFGYWLIFVLALFMTGWWAYYRRIAKQK
jgi:apolipoprotein N-acyltransferase